VLRETDPQATLWELLLPEQAKRLPAELARVDAYLDDERFIAPWRGLFSTSLGRPSVPVESLLRLLYLKHRYGLGYESLCREVADSISWRRFCRAGGPARGLRVRRSARRCRGRPSHASVPRVAGQGGPLDVRPARVARRPLVRWGASAQRPPKIVAARSGQSLLGRGAGAVPR